MEKIEWAARVVGNTNVFDLVNSIAGYLSDPENPPLLGLLTDLANRYHNEIRGGLQLQGFVNDVPTGIYGDESARCAPLIAVLTAGSQIISFDYDASDGFSGGACDPDGNNTQRRSLVCVQRRLLEVCRSSEDHASRAIPPCHGTVHELESQSGSCHEDDDLVPAAHLVLICSNPKGWCLNKATDNVRHQPPANCARITTLVNSPLEFRLLDRRSEPAPSLCGFHLQAELAFQMRRRAKSRRWARTPRPGALGTAWTKPAGLKLIVMSNLPEIPVASIIGGEPGKKPFN